MVVLLMLQSSSTLCNIIRLFSRLSLDMKRLPSHDLNVRQFCECYVIRLQYHVPTLQLTVPYYFAM